MSWWENLDDEFKSFLANLIGVGVGVSVAQDQMFKEPNKDPKSYSSIGPDIPKAIGDITADHEKAGVQPAASPSPTPSPTASGNQPPPVIGPAANTPAGSEWDAIKKIADSAPSTQRQTQGSISGVDPNAPVFESRRKERRQIGDAKEFAPKTLVINNTRTLGEVANDPFGWDEKKLKSVSQMMIDAGYIKPGADLMDVANVWGRLSAISALQYQKGKRVTPLDILRGQSFGLIGGAGIGRGPKTVTSTDTDYTVTNATTAKQLAQAALSQRVGRKATDEEVAEFIKDLREEEKANPSVRTTTTTTNADGTSQTSTSTTKQGINVEAFQRQWADEYDTEEAKAYQAVGFYAPIFFEALKAPA